MSVAVLGNESNVARTEGSELRIMSSNIWGDYFKNPPHEREDLLIAVFRRYSPDVLALQEVTPNWWKSKLFTALSSEYAVVDGDAASQDKTNYTPLMYRKDRFELVDSGWDIFHIKLDRSKSLTWAVLKDVKTGKLLVTYSTHFWWKGGVEHDYIRSVNAEKMIERLEGLRKKYDCAVMGGGDFNCNISSDAYAVMVAASYESSQEFADWASPECSHHGNPVRDENNVYRGQLRPSDNEKRFSIDHLVGYKPWIRVLREQVILDQDALDASDHSPIFVDVVLGK